MTGSANPFVGPRPFEPGEPLWGRDREVRELDNLIAAERVVLLHSPSGAGKSSLMQAGLLPRLKKTFDIWGPTRLNLEPPVGSPANRYVLSALLGLEEGVPERLRRPPQALAGQSLRDYARQRPRRRSAPGSILIVFDQFEEILTVDPLAAAAKEEFFDQAGELLRDPGVWALFALREDYLAPLDPYSRRVPTHLANRFRIDLLGLDSAIEAMINPARAGGREFPASGQLARDLARRQVQQLDGTFVEQVGQHVEPVQLQVVCRRLWDAMPPEDLSIDAEDLAQFGDVDTALSGYYAEAVGRLAAGSLATERALRDWFGEALVIGGIRSQVLRRTGSSGGLANHLVESLLDTHLVRAEKRAGATWYELAHDRLIGAVQRDNQEWREKNLAPAQRRAEIWERQGRPPGLLLAGADLVDAERWAAGQSAVVTELERRFLALSREAQTLAEREQRQAARVQRLAIVAMVIGALALLAGGFAFVQMLEADGQRREALAQREEADRQREEAIRQREQVENERRRAEQEKQAADDARVEAVAQRGAAEQQKQIAEEQGRRAAAEELKAQAKAGEAEEARREAEGQRGQALQEKQRAEKLKIEAESSERDAQRLSRLAAARAVALQTLRPVREGQEELSALLVAAAWRLHRENQGEAGDPDLFNALRTALGRLRPDPVLRGAGDAVRSLVADGGAIIAGSDDGGIRRYELAPPAAPPELLGRLPGGVRALALSADGGWLAAGSAGGAIRIFDRRGAAAPRDLAPSGALVGALAFQPGAHRLAAGGADGQVRIWDLDQPAEPSLELTAGAGRITALAFSPDGATLAAGQSPGGALLWDARKPADARPACAGKDLRSLAFSPDGRILACGAGRGEILLAPAAGAGAGISLAGHSSSVNGLAFSPQGDLLASASSDGTLRLWDLRHPGVLPVALHGHEGWVWAVAFTLDGGRLLSGGADAAVRRWEARSALLAAEICGFVHRALSKEEWAQHVPAGLAFPEEAPCPPAAEPESRGFRAGIS